MHKIVIAFFTVLFTLTISAQDSKQVHSGDHGHTHEIGIAVSPVYFVREKSVSPGLHLHYLYNIHDTKFAIGAGYERIFDEHQHNTVGIVAGYSPVEKWNVNVSPGLTFEKDSPNPNFALHIETSYEFEFNHFHIGPAVEIAYDKEDYHLSVGLHVGLGF